MSTGNSGDVGQMLGLAPPQDSPAQPPELVQADGTSATVQPATEVAPVTHVQPAVTSVQHALLSAATSVQPGVVPAVTPVQPVVPAATSVQAGVVRVVTPVQPVVPAATSVQPGVVAAVTPVEPVVPAATFVQPGVHAVTPVQPVVPVAPPVQQVVSHGTPDTPAPPCTPYRRAPGTPVPAAQSKAAARPPPREDAMSDHESDHSLSSDVEEHVSEPAEKEPDPCPICLEKVQVGEAVTALPCAHVCHNECLSKWRASRPGGIPLHHCPMRCERTWQSEMEHVPSQWELVEAEGEAAMETEIEQIFG